MLERVCISVREINQLAGEMDIRCADSFGARIFYRELLMETANKLPIEAHALVSDRQIVSEQTFQRELYSDLFSRDRI